MVFHLVFAAIPVWYYTFFLAGTLGVWLLYLVLPRGFRKQYCSSHRKRYPRRRDTSMPEAGYWLPANKSMSDTGSSVVHHPRHPSRRAQSNPAVFRGRARVPGTFPPQHQPQILESSSSSTSLVRNNSLPRETSTTTTPSTPQRDKPPGSGGSPYHSRSGKPPPSPEHPALRKIPPNKVLEETMARLRGRGIRLVAHGVHCDAKRVWIKLDDEGGSVTWQTEFPRRVPNQSGQVSIVLMRGSVHKISLRNVLYIDVGKKTNALLRLESQEVPEGTCFSLLTQNGSLDLQANSKLERDSLVSCFSMILDDVHASEDWRALYEQSPDPSLVGSSMAGGGPPSGVGLGRLLRTPSSSGKPASDRYPNPAEMLVEV